MEKEGQISVLLFDQPRPRLSIMPPLERGEAASCPRCGLTRTEQNAPSS